LAPNPISLKKKVIRKKKKDSLAIATASCGFHVANNGRCKTKGPHGICEQFCPLLRVRLIKVLWSREENKVGI
jgi:hypothetical protein